MKRTIKFLASLMLIFAAAFGVQVNSASADTLKCTASRTQPCVEKINTDDKLVVYYPVSSQLTVNSINKNHTKTAQILPTIGSQAQQPFNIQPGGRITKRYETQNFLNATFDNQSAESDTNVELTISVDFLQPVQVHYRDNIKLYLQKYEGYIVSASERKVANLLYKAYFPQFSTSKPPVYLQLSGGRGGIRDGDTLLLSVDQKRK